MIQIPDAPWIRDAERYGYPEPDPVKCPCCGEECETIYMDQCGTVFACDVCLDHKDAYEWAEEEKERNRPDWADEI